MDRRLALLGASLFTLGMWLSGPPLPVDSATQQLPKLGQLLVSTSFLLGALLWGRVFVNALHWNLSNGWSFVLGLSGLNIVVWVLGALGFLHFQAAWPIRLGFALIFVISAIRPLERSPLQLPSLSYFRRWETGLPWALLAVIFVIRFVESLKLLPSGDPYIYHLYAPRAWFDDHGYKRFTDFFYFYHTGWFESLIQWGNIFFAGPPGTGLSASQRFAQLIELIAGFGLAGWAAHRLIPKHPWSLLAALAVVSTPLIAGNASFAKNDWIVATWWLLAWVILMLEPMKDPRWAVWAGFLMGQALFSKWIMGPMVVSAVILGAVSLFQNQRPSIAFRSIALFGIGGLLAGAPVLLRNWMTTGNPMFPWMTHLFGTQYLGPYALNANSNYLTSIRLSENVVPYILETLKLGPPIALGFLPLLFRPLRQKREIFWSFLLAALSWAWYLMQFRPSTHIWRYYAPGICLFSILGIAVLHEAVIRFKWAARIQTLIFIAACLVVFTAAHHPLHTLLRLNSYHHPTDSEAVLRLTGGHAKRWIRQNIPPSDLVVSLADNELYYVSDRYVRDWAQTAWIDSAFNGKKEPYEFLQAARQVGARWLYLLLRLHDGEWSTVQKRLLDWVKARCPPAVMYEDHAGQIISIEAIDKNCAGLR